MLIKLDFRYQNTKKNQVEKDMRSKKIAMLNKQIEDWEWDTLPDFHRKIRYLKWNTCCFCPYHKKIRGLEHTECLCFTIKTDVLSKKVDLFNKEVCAFRDLFNESKKEAKVDIDIAFDFSDIQRNFIPPLDNEINYLNKKIDIVAEKEHLSEVKSRLKDIRLLSIIQSE